MTRSLPFADGSVRAIRYVKRKVKNMSKLYSVTHQAYCGMTIPIADGLGYKDAIARAKRRIEWFKARIGGEVVKQGSNQWELCEPENCCMIPDSCGTLLVQPDEEVVIQ